MNYLAHAYLSFNNPALLTGNMISDFVKGKKQYDYPERIQQGIRLHRAIDAFTDSHPSTRELRECFRPYYRLYSGAFADVVYDFFLANDMDEFNTEADLKSFTIDTYERLDEMKDWLPDDFHRFFQSMKKDNWLFHYRYEWGIRRSFNGIVRRAAYLEESDRAFDIFLDKKDLLRSCYQEFFPALKDHARLTMEQLLQTE